MSWDSGVCSSVRRLVWVCDAILCPGTLVYVVVFARFAQVCGAILCPGTLVYVVVYACESNNLF